MCKFKLCEICTEKIGSWEALKMHTTIFSVVNTILANRVM